MARNRFNKLNSNSDFPDIGNVDVYKFDNEFDYSRYNKIQMRLQLCTVPWDVGEAHVGQRTLSGIGNVVYFETEENRDAWFASIPDDKCYRFETKFKQLHREMKIDVPIPFDIASRFNYLVVEYEPFANADSLVEYEELEGKCKWFWFVREVEFLAPNNTRLHLLDDAFQTWIYDVNVSNMILERGHAPMFEVPAPIYLSEPVTHNKGLLTEDINFGDAPSVTKHIDAVVLNSGDMYACIATSADPRGDWGKKSDDSWTVPGSSIYTQNGVPGVFVFACEASELSTLMLNVSTDIPQFKQTVQGVFFAPKQLVTIAAGFMFAGVECFHLSSTRQTFDMCVLEKRLFDYPTEYADIAKLYTSPYAHIEVTDENGQVDVIKIEDTTGDIDVSAAMSLSFPFITIDAHMLGTGGKAGTSVSFRNITSKTFDIGGNWYETLHSWNVPTFAVTLLNKNDYDYSTHFDRKQKVVDYDTAYTNAEASAATAKATGDAMALTNRNNATNIAAAQRTCSNRSAQALRDNAQTQADANTAITTRSNTCATNDTIYGNALGVAVQAWEAGYTNDTTNNEVNAEYASAAIGAAGGLASGVVSGAMAGGPIGAIGGLVSGAISGVTSVANTAVAANLKQEQADASNTLSEQKTRETNQNNSDRTGLQTAANTDNTTTTNNAARTVAGTNATVQVNNATTTYTAQSNAASASYTTETDNNDKTYKTAEANAERARTQAKSAIENEIKQARLGAPLVFGNASNGESATTKPMALFMNIVTQSENAIAAAGDEFLRYGYMYNMRWPFNGNWNIGKYFTYWKLSDFWVSDLQVPDLYMDKLRFFLFGGVTIWRKPEYIGKVSIYDNFG